MYFRRSPWIRFAITPLSLRDIFLHKRVKPFRHPSDASLSGTARSGESLIANRRDNGRYTVAVDIYHYKKRQRRALPYGIISHTFPCTLQQ